MEINEPTEEFSDALTRIKRNRIVIEGEDAIKAAGETYLPKLISQTKDQYQAWLNSLGFFPASQRTLDNHVGLIFRKPPSLVSDPVDADLIETISHRYNLEQLSELLLRETLITNFTILLMDSGEQPAGLTMKKAREEGYRPFLAVYKGDSILEVTEKVVRSKRIIQKVRMLDNKDTVRVLELIDGVYTVTIHRRTQDGWQASSTVPTQNRKPLTEIPIVIVSTQPGAISPPKAPMDDICRKNLEHFRMDAKLNNILRHIASPVRWMTGVKIMVNEAGQTIWPYRVSPDQMWTLEDANAKLGILEHSGKGAESFEKRLSKIEEQLAAIGARIIQPEKSGVEAAETHAIKKSAETSIMAMIANTVSAACERATNMVMAAIGSTPVQFKLNTDFMPMPMTAQEITSQLALVQANMLSHRTFFDNLKAGEIVNDALTFEDELERIEEEEAAAPPVTVDPNPIFGLDPDDSDDAE